MATVATVTKRRTSSAEDCIAELARARSNRPSPDHSCPTPYWDRGGSPDSCNSSEFEESRALNIQSTRSGTICHSRTAPEIAVASTSRAQVQSRGQTGSYTLLNDGWLSARQLPVSEKPITVVQYSQTGPQRIVTYAELEDCPFQPQTNKRGPDTGSWGGPDESDEELQNRVRSTNMALNHEDFDHSTFQSYGSTDNRDTGISLTVPMTHPAASPHYYDANPLENKLRRRLRFFFMNPIEKWQARRQFPFKLLIQLIKIVLVTLQLCIFASSRYGHVNYARNTQVAFSHLFLMGWDTSREVVSYPPADGPLAVYKHEEYYAYLDFAINAFGTIETAPVGRYFYPHENRSTPSMQFCRLAYAQNNIWGFNDSFILDKSTKQECIEIVPSPQGNFSVEQFFREKNFTTTVSGMIEARLKFGIQTVNLQPVGPLSLPDCFLFNIELVFDNRNDDGQLKVSLEIDPKRIECHGEVKPPTSEEASHRLKSGLNITVIIISVFSFILCARALINAQFLKWETCRFFSLHRGTSLSVQDKLEFLNLWYLLIIANDILLVVGSAFKELIETKRITTDLWDLCSVLLGTGNLFVWVGVLRYLGFFRPYNILIVTLKRAIPHVLRFLLCAMLIYAGYCFCGWLIFGPYHYKFRSLASTSECLFSLVNGDDMFATFDSYGDVTGLIWLYSRVYLYSFISLFIYVVLSLFIALIMDSFETIKLYYAEGFPKSELHEFITPTGMPVLTPGMYRNHSDVRLSDKILKMFGKERGNRPEEYEPIVA